jgi:hypothetical protein
MMGYPANGCLFGSRRNEIPRKPRLQRLRSFRRDVAEAGPRCLQIPKSRAHHTHVVTIPPERCASPAKGRLSHSFKSAIPELLA